MAGDITPPAASTPPSSLAVQEGHGGHTAAPSGSNGAFASALSQAISQQANSPGAAHGGHGTAAAASGAGGTHGGGHTSALALNAGSNRSAFEQGDHAGHDFQQKMLGIRAYRQQLLASNIANADTPGYKALDIDIEEAARIAKGTSATVSLATTSPGHMTGGAQTPPFPLKYHVPHQMAADGNTVEMDIERQKFAENSLMYQFSRDRVSDHFKHLMELFQSLK